ncbi:hypothetical protein CEE36_10585 [candidate division TA06 bacterium B3_TA06]|uniref:TonB-dependent receptor plug domain-containing protein n=1 Tax=candidate division TA06 bacterium B3_TA06 TaxID=2012487 RepID=A0A532UU80_UNCT6|nr:MAG: hypothetical protein CEE36_10585 [candidate division TA06 bacterium B3_TA06]
MKFVTLLSAILMVICVSLAQAQTATTETLPDISLEEEPSDGSDSLPKGPYLHPDSVGKVVEVTDELKNKSQTILHIVSVEESPPIIEEDPSTGITITGEEIEHMPVDNIEQVLENLVPGVVNTSP